MLVHLKWAGGKIWRRSMHKWPRITWQNKPGGYGLHRYPRKEEDFLPKEKIVT